MRSDVNKLFEELGSLSQVEAIALGGSRATGRNDESSDYDVYVYITSSIDENERRNILEKYCRYMEIGNSFWELEDDVTLHDGIDMDIIYRNMKDFENMVSSVVIDCVPWNGYTTCMWLNLIYAVILSPPQIQVCITILLHYSILWSAFPTPEKISLSIIILPIGIFLFTNTYLGQRF